MNDDGQLDSSLDGLCQVISVLGSHDAGHVLDADGVNAHLLQVAAQLYEHIDVVDGRCCVAQCTLNMSTGLDGLINSNFDVAQVVQRVEDTDDVDAVLNALADEGANDVIGIVLVTQQVLAAEQHLCLCVLEVLADCAQSLPGIFVEVTEAGVKCSAAPALDGVVAGLVNGVQDGLEVLDRHSCGDQRLVTIAQDGLCKIDLHDFSPSEENF